MMRNVVYIFDAYCGWCFGFSPAINELAADPEINVRVVHGALFTGDRVQPISNYDYIPGANQQITNLTGAQFGDAYNALFTSGSSFAMDSDDAARGFVALKLVGGEERGVEFALAMQKAFYRAGLSLSDEATYRALAEQLGLGADILVEVFNSEDAARLAREEQAWIANLGVQSYPTPLLETAQGYGVIGTATSTEEQMKAVIAQN